ncbi:hypothetical protein Tco_0691608 [Tanacetum coccineum]
MGLSLFRDDPIRRIESESASIVHLSSYSDSLIKMEFLRVFFADSLMKFAQAIASASSSSEYSWSESRLNSGDLNSSTLRVLKCLLDDQNSRSVSIPDDRYAVYNGSGYAVLICWDEYAVLDRELDTPYPIEVDTPYSTVDQNSVSNN